MSNSALALAIAAQDLQASINSTYPDTDTAATTLRNKLTMVKALLPEDKKSSPLNLLHAPVNIALKKAGEQIIISFVDQLANYPTSREALIKLNELDPNQEPDIQKTLLEIDLGVSSSTEEEELLAKIQTTLSQIGGDKQKLSEFLANAFLIAQDHKAEDLLESIMAIASERELTTQVAKALNQGRSISELAKNIYRNSTNPNQGMQQACIQGDKLALSIALEKGADANQDFGVIDLSNQSDEYHQTTLIIPKTAASLAARYGNKTTLMPILKPYLDTERTYHVESSYFSRPNPNSPNTGWFDRPSSGDNSGEQTISEILSRIN